MDFQLSFLMSAFSDPGQKGLIAEGHRNGLQRIAFPAGRGLAGKERLIASVGFKEWTISRAAQMA